VVVSCPGVSLEGGKERKIRDTKKGRKHIEIQKGKKTQL